MNRNTPERGIALITVLLATTLLLVLVGVLLDLGTVQLQRSTEDLRALQALAGADAGTSWVREVLDAQHGDVTATIEHLAVVSGRRRFFIDDHTYVIASVSLIQSTPQKDGNHLDENLEQNPQVLEQPLQVQSSATLFAYGKAVAGRATTTLLRVFPSAPYSEIAGVIDDGGPVGIQSPGDAGGQQGAADSSELLVNAYTLDANGNRHSADQFGNEQWSDNNTSGAGPLP